MANDPRNTRNVNLIVESLQQQGVALPQNGARARMAALEMHQMATAPSGSPRSYGVGTSASDAAAIEEQTRLINAMGRQRSASRRTSSMSGGDIAMAVPRFYDPLEYWDLSGLPWNMADEGHRHKLHKWLRLYYATHYLVPILIDIFTRFPLVGMELKSKDKSLKNFYEELFFEQLDYGEFLVQLGREFWCVGEAFPMGSFDEDLGIWEREELLNPEDIVIENFPMLGSQQLKIAPPDYLKKLAQTKQPAREFRMLELNYPELIPYLRKNEHIPISGVLLKQVANKLTSWDDHGTPILLRGLRTLIHEEKLLASQDAIAERLYSPLILAKLGVMDLGDGQGPWIPDPDQLDAFRDDMDVALSSDFRLLVHHFGLEVNNVFGREQMPRLGDDFDRIERRIMQIFGVNPSLLSAGSNSQPYASSALQAEFLNQILRTFQDYLKRHFRDRALVVAEAQGHYEYEVRGASRVPVMEEVVVYDDEGNKSIEERNKLLIPEMDFKTLDLRDEATERQFLMTLRGAGVPIPDAKLMIGVDVDFEDLVDEYNDELIIKTLKQQKAKVKTYNALATAGDPIPPDLRAEVESSGQMAGAEGPGGAMAGPGGLPTAPGGAGGPGGPPPGGPGAAGPGGAPGESIVMPPVPPGLGPGGDSTVPGGGPPPASPMSGGPAGTVPDVSNERRPGLHYGSAEETTEDDVATQQSSAMVSDDESEQGHQSALRPTEIREKDQIVRLPRAVNKRSYTILDPDAETLDDTDDEQQPEPS